MPAPARGGSSTTRSGVRPASVPGFDPAPLDLRPRQVGQVGGGVVDRGRVGLHAEHRAGRADRLGQRGGQRAGAGVEVEHALPRPRRQPVQQRGREGLERGRVHLPEAGRACAGTRARPAGGAPSPVRTRPSPGPAAGAREPAGPGPGRCASTVTPSSPRTASIAGRAGWDGTRVGDLERAERAVPHRLELVRAVPVQPDLDRCGRRRTGPGCASRAGRRAAPRPRRGRPRCRRGGGTARARSRPSAARCAGPPACCQSQPPQRPGPACGHGGLTRSGEAASTSTASARQKDRRRPRSPGRAPARRATRAGRTRPGPRCGRRRSRRARAGRPRGRAGAPSSQPTAGQSFAFGTGTDLVARDGGRVRPGAPARARVPPSWSRAATARW